MNIQTTTAVSSYYDSQDGDMPYWLPQGCVMLSSKAVAAANDDFLKHDESLSEYSYTTVAEAIAHFGLVVPTYTEAEISALLLRSNKAVLVACARLERVQGVRNRITEYACYSNVVAEADKAQARQIALANVPYLTVLANTKAAQKALDDLRWAEINARFAAKAAA